MSFGPFEAWRVRDLPSGRSCSWKARHPRRAAGTPLQVRGAAAGLASGLGHVPAMRDRIASLACVGGCAQPPQLCNAVL